MRLETVKVVGMQDEGLEKHLVRVYVKGEYVTTFSVTYDELEGEIWLEHSKKIKVVLSD